jgi:hypothetical protein
MMKLNLLNLRKTISGEPGEVEFSNLTTLDYFGPSHTDLACLQNIVLGLEIDLQEKFGPMSMSWEGKGSGFA